MAVKVTALKFESAALAATSGTGQEALFNNLIQSLRS
ncbi:hypothetical protein PC116_g28217 [Phytophthora cactorum]|uniref:Uncharacterized protein n=1 Tax=Phytophthora cactorum TaxID=29920 RepID=A0A8T1JJW0_9STRA|nr:hypothetical protein PC111_g22846 [Phytophthora cactorum]KAG2873197.1 hypothetical protein PC114_g25985 [Phytophthora cactorum]KAG2906050.1 hypothetical protein PC117_g20598 [Phytophthora cactorum]KAG2969321.1 hypothetical protein PC119_g23953 [Phytophthora cactorum]KAG2973289.1 hypothetical protein PC120_g26167 [Phytophthora cactorum]